MENQKKKGDTGRQLLNLRWETGMNRRKFAEYFGIPYRTVQDWELGNREMPAYLLRLIAYKLRMEGMLGQEEQTEPTGDAEQ